MPAVVEVTGAPATRRTIGPRFEKAVAALNAAEEEELCDAIDDDSSPREEVEVNSDKEPSAGEDQAKEAAMKNVVFYGQKMGAWVAWTIHAKADPKKVTKKTEQMNSSDGPLAGEEQVDKAGPGTTAGLSYTGLVGKAARKAKAAEKAARKLATMKKESSVNEQQAREAAQKKEAIYEEKIAAWKLANQARADVEEAHEKPIDVEATEKAADGKAALGNDTTIEATYEQMVEAWIA